MELSNIKINKKIFFFGLIFLFVFPLSAQDINFSSNYYLKDIINPSLVVFNQCSKIFFHSSNLALNYSGGVKNILTGVSAYYPKYKSGFTFFVQRKIFPNNIINRFNVGGSYSFNIKINKKISVVPSLILNYYQQKYNLNNIIFPSMINPISGSIESSNISSYPNNNLSFLYGGLSGIITYDKYFIGGKIENVFDYFLNGYSADVRKNYSLIFGGEVIKRQYHYYFLFSNQNLELNYIEGIIEYKKLSLGTGIGISNITPYKLSINTSYKYKKWTFIVGYNFFISPGHFSEYLLGIELNFNCKKSQKNTIICPAYEF